MDDMLQQKRDVTSAMYYLVWHLGLSYAVAEKVVEGSKTALDEFARLGRIEGRMCFRALSALVQKIGSSDGGACPK
jgi:hypothetical protein